MKSFVILLVAGIMLLKPLWPLVDYVANYDYIKNVLCENKDRPMMDCDGKCYLSKLLAQENGKNEKNPFGEKQNGSEINQPVFFEVLPQLAFDAAAQLSSPKITTAVQHIIATLLTEDLTRPPESA